MKANPQPFDWDYDGACDPGSGKPWAKSNHTFSVGIFQWLPKRSGSGLKRGKVVKRVRGYTSNPQSVYAQAERWIAQQTSLGLSGSAGIAQ